MKSGNKKQVRLQESSKQVVLTYSWSSSKLSHSWWLEECSRRLAKMIDKWLEESLQWRKRWSEILISPEQYQRHSAKGNMIYMIPRVSKPINRFDSRLYNQLTANSLALVLESFSTPALVSKGLASIAFPLSELSSSSSISFKTLAS